MQWFWFGDIPVAGPTLRTTCSSGSSASAKSRVMDPVCPSRCRSRRREPDSSPGPRLPSPCYRALLPSQLRGVRGIFSRELPIQSKLLRRRQQRDTCQIGSLAISLWRLRDRWFREPEKPRRRPLPPGVTRAQDLEAGERAVREVKAPPQALLDSSLSLLKGLVLGYEEVNADEEYEIDDSP